MTTRCVLLDFGNVIAFFDHRKACGHLAELSTTQARACVLHGLAEVRCPPGECLYVDDRDDFVAVGRAIGLNGLVYTPGVDVLGATCY